MPTPPVSFAYWNRGEVAPFLGGKNNSGSFKYWNGGEVYPADTPDTAVGPANASAAFVPGPFVMNAAANEPPTAAGAFVPGPFVMNASVEEKFTGSGYFQPGPFVMDVEALVQPTANAVFLPGPFVLGAAVVAQPAAAGGFVPDPFVLLIFATVTFPHTGPLAVTSVSPAFGGGPTLLTVLGAGFLGTTNITFGPYHFFDADSPNGFSNFVTVVSDTEIHVLVQPSPFFGSSASNDPITVDVQVFTVDQPAGSPLNPPLDQYTFLAPPTVYSINPTSGTTAADTPVVIRGKNMEHTTLIQLGAIGAAVGGFVISADGRTLACSLTTTAFSGNLSAPYLVRVWNDAGPGLFNDPTFTVYPGPQIFVPTILALDDALSGRFGPVAISYKYEQRDRQYNLIQDITSAVLEEGGASVHLDNNQAVARTADFVFDASLLPPGFIASTPSRFAVAVSAHVTVGLTVYVLPLGLFHLDLPTQMQYPNGYEEWHAKGADMALVLADRTTPIPYVVPAGSTYLNIVAGICASFGLSQAISSIPNLGYITPIDFVWPAGVTYLQICNDLLFGINCYPIWATETGVMITRYRNDPAVELPSAIYTTLTEPRMLVGEQTTRTGEVNSGSYQGTKAYHPLQNLPVLHTRTQQVSQFNNQISVAIDDPARVPVTVTRTNMDPNSPLSIPSSGKTNFKAITGNGQPSSKCVFNPAVAAVIADFEIRNEAAMAVRRHIATQPDPRRTNREWYRLTLEGYDVATLWRAVKWDLACSPGGPHTHEVEFAQEIVVVG